MGNFNQEILNVATSYEGRHIPYGTSAGHIDCSHFVAQIIEKATGQHFSYMVANDYIRSPHFRKVDKPDKGDIVFWHETPHGHVGVVLDPNVGLFIGSQSTHGVGEDHYTSHYWKSHGSGPQFLRFEG